MRPSPLRPVLAHPVLRRVLPGLAVSALGDGMSVVAVGWLALQLAPDGGRGGWVAAAVAAYSLPSALGGVLFGRYLRHRGGAQLAGWNATLRAAGLGAVAVAYAAGVLGPGLYVALLALSSLLAAWGSAGRYTLVAELLPAEHHLAANGLLTAIGEFATIAGPPLAGLLIARTGAAAVIGLDAASFAVLAATYRLAVPPTPATRAEPAAPDPRPAGNGRLPRDPAQLGLLALSFAFFLLFGPFYTAMPIRVADELHAPATVLGVYYTAFGVGAVAGGLAAARLHRLPLWPATIGAVTAFGAAMLPLGLGAPAPVALAGFAVAGLCWSPYLSTSMALFQRSTPPDRLPGVLAAYGSVTVVSVPLGAALGGPLVTALGAGRTLLLSAVATIALGVAAGGVMAAKSYRRPREKMRPGG